MCKFCKEYSYLVEDFGHDSGYDDEVIYRYPDGINFNICIDDCYLSVVAERPNVASKEIKIPIIYCPMCGTKLIEENEEEELPFN